MTNKSEHMSTVICDKDSVLFTMDRDNFMHKLSLQLELDRAM